MRAKDIPWLRIVKLLVGLTILFFIGRRFAQDLKQPELYTESISVGWLILSAVLYLIGLGLSCVYWGWLIDRLGVTPNARLLTRAYYVGHLGKYVPGKAFAIVIRAGMGKTAGVRPGLGALTAFYEVMITMGAGAVFAMLVCGGLTYFAPWFDASAAWSQAWRALRYLEEPEQSFAPAALLVVSLALVVGVLWPVLPPIYNHLADRLSLPFRETGRIVPKIRWRHMLVGIAFGLLAWVFLGAGMNCAMYAIPGATLPLSMFTLLHVTAILAIAYVSAFLVLFAPGGLGVRELFLAWMLTPEIAWHNDLTQELARGKVVLLVLLVRLAWTVAEVIVAAALYRLPRGVS